MKLRLPNGDIRYLDTSLSLEERKEVVNGILEEWNDYFQKSWELRKTQVCLDILGNYICLVKDGEDKNKEDKYIMSKTKIKHMEKGNKKNTIFSDLSKEKKLAFGLYEADENEGEG